MSKNITDIAQYGLVWGLKELRCFLDTDQELKEKVKIAYMKTDSVRPGTLTRFAASLAAFQDQQGSYQIKDPAIVKITAIMNEFNITTEVENGIVVACGGKGDINTGLQNDSAQFTAAQGEAARLVCDDEVNFAVFIDKDVKTKIIDALTKKASREMFSTYTEEVCPLENFEAQAQRDPSERFALLQQSTKKVLTAMDNFAANETNLDKTRQINYIRKLVELHSISMIRADESYQELKDERTAEKKSLEARLELNKELMDEMARESDERENQYKKQLQDKDDEYTELEKNLRTLQELKGEDKELDHDEQVQSLQNQMRELTSQKDAAIQNFVNQTKASKEAIHKLEQEKHELALKLEKKNLALIRLEQQHTKARESAESVARNLEQKELTPAHMARMALSDPITPNPHNLRGIRKNTSFNERTLPRPQVLNLDSDLSGSLVGQISRRNDEREHSPLVQSSLSQTSPMNNSPSQNPTTQTPTQRTNQRPIICKPANFGLNTWNPLTTDIYVHLDKAIKARREALNVGASSTSARRMILNSLGPKCDHVENFIEGAENMTLPKFAEAIGKILGKKSSVQMQSFLTAQRRSGEDLLAYFTRLHMLYRSSNKLTEYTGWEEDPTHSMSFYSKIFDACYQAQKTELIRKTEELLEKGDLTLPKLKCILVDVNKIDASKLSAEEPQIAMLKDSTTYGNDKIAPKEIRFGNASDNEEKHLNDKVNKDWKRKIVCWHCNTPGHTKLQCFKYIRKMKEDKGYPRETKTRGSNPKDNNTQH